MVVAIRSIYIAFLLSFFAAIPAAALNPDRRITQYILDAYGLERGLPQNTVNSVIQTRDGYLWVGTQEGLVRFDGVYFELFTTKNTPVFTSNFIQVLFQDREERLWVGTNGGGVYLKDRKGWRRYDQKQGLGSSVVMAFCQDHKGRIWLGAEDGLYYFEGERFLRRELPGVEKAFGVRALLADRKGGLWVGTYGQGLYHIKGDEFLHYGRAQGLVDDVIISLLEDASGRIWAGTYSSGLFYLDGEGWRQAWSGSGQETSRIMALHRDCQGSLWLGTYGGGLARFSRGRFEFWNEQSGFPSNIVMSIGEDQEGNLWVGTLTAGLVQLRDGKFFTLGQREGLTAEVVMTIREDSAGGLWLGTTSGGLYRIQGEEIVHFGKQQGLPSEQVLSLQEGQGGRLLVGTNAGLAIWDGQRWETVDIPGRVKSPLVFTIFEETDGSVWIGTDGGGLMRRYSDGRWESFSTENGFPDNFVRYLMKDSRGNFWIGTSGGLVRMNSAGLKLWRKEQGLPSNLVLAIYEVAGGDILVGTLSGLALVRETEEKNTVFSSPHFQETVLCILEDHLGYLWMSSNQGLLRGQREKVREALLRGQEPRLERFGLADGMRSAECNGGNQPACWKSRDGRLWFATVKGAVAVDPEYLPKNPVPPPVHIEKVVADGKIYDVSEPVILPPGTFRLEIHYTALSFVAPQKVHFRYRLQGYDREEIPATNRRVAYYTGLPPGKYRFRVSACNNDGVWNEVGATVLLAVKPFFYQTIWFRVLMAQLALSLVSGGYWLRVISLKRRQRELERLVTQRTLELIEANKKLERQKEELLLANQTLEKISTIDALTGLANRRRFDEVFDLEWRRAQRNGSWISLLMIDVDFFKRYNDNYGHHWGDQCLRRVANALSDNIKRPSDLVARYGGEEFAVILPDTDPQGALVVAERLRQAVAALNLTHEYNEASGRVTISVGVACLVPSSGNNPADLLLQADEALYEAKRSGRNRVWGKPQSRNLQPSSPAS